MKRNITLAGVAAAGALLFTQPASPASVAGVNIAMTNVAVNGCGSIEVYVNLNRSSGLRRRVTLTLSIYRVTASGSLGTRVATGYSSMVQGLRSQKFVNVYRGTTSRATFRYFGRSTITVFSPDGRRRLGSVTVLSPGGFGV